MSPIDGFSIRFRLTTIR